MVIYCHEITLVLSRGFVLGSGVKVVHVSVSVDSCDILIRITTLEIKRLLLLSIIKLYGHSVAMISPTSKVSDSEIVPDPV